MQFNELSLLWSNPEHLLVLLIFMGFLGYSYYSLTKLLIYTYKSNKLKENIEIKDN